MKIYQTLSSRILALLIVILTIRPVTPLARAQQPGVVASAVSKPVIVEWVYRTTYGYKDEWWRIFKKYQLAILERQKQLGYVKEYTVYAPSLHTSEDSRWDYRVIILRASEHTSAGKSESELAKQLFPDRGGLTRDENRRWELTLNYWDLPYPYRQARWIGVMGGAFSHDN
jgi:hypothetical protein